MENQPTATTDNPYGLAALWATGDIIARAVLVLLLIMSLASWYVMLTKLWDQRKLKQSARIVEKQFWSAPSIKDGVDRLKKGDDFRAIAEDGLRAASHHDGRLTDRIDLHEWITMSLQRAVEGINSKLAKRPGSARDRRLGSTVRRPVRYGLGHSERVGVDRIAGQASIDKVAGPVGEALIMTAIGLFVAVPAVMVTTGCWAATSCSRTRCGNFASDLHAYLVSGARMGSEGGGGVRPAAAKAAREE